MQTLAGWPLERLDQCDSSNSELLRRAANLPDRWALVVDTQTAGRGRRGRAWFSPPGANLYLSLFARLALPATRLAGLSLAVGIGVAETLRGLGAAEVGLKWPNDLLARGRKLGGILIEMAAARAGSSEAVIGLGLNLRLPADTDVGQPIIDLETLGVHADRDAVLAALLPALGRVLDQFSREGLDGFVARWAAVDLLRGEAVTLSEGSRRQGVVLGIGADGCLRLSDEAGVFEVGAGEVSVRRNGAD